MADSDSEHDDDDFSLADFELDDADDRRVMFGIAFCGFIVDRMVEDFGPEAVTDLMYAIDRNMGWSSEILANQHEIENLLYDRHGAFDAHIWQKVQQTQAWAKMYRQVYKVSRKYLALAVDEVVLSERSDTP